MTDNRQPRAWTWTPIAVGVVLVALIAYGLGRSDRDQAAPVANVAAVPQAAPPGATALAAGTLIEWDQEKSPGPSSYFSEGLLITASERQKGENYQPIVEVSRDGVKLAEIVGAEHSGRASAQIGVGRIDAAAEGPQVLVTTFTGGAHCCAATQLAAAYGGTWKVIDVATQDGARLAEFPQDYDGDGKVEVRIGDDRFLYAFDAYAASRSPPTFVQVVAGVLNDVSAKPGLRAQYEFYAAEVLPECRQGSNGACAAYAATAARLGSTDQAWPIVLASYDRQASWDYPTACTSAGNDQACPDADRVVFETYPEALRWFLGDAGYLPKIYLPSRGSTAPSFPCGRVTSQVLELVCATPVLAKADRDLAWTYQRAMALSSEPAALRDAERAFIALRNNSPPDVFSLLRLYLARIEALQANLPP